MTASIINPAPGLNQGAWRYSDVLQLADEVAGAGYGLEQPSLGFPYFGALMSTHPLERLTSLGSIGARPGLPLREQFDLVRRVARGEGPASVLGDAFKAARSVESRVTLPDLAALLTDAWAAAARLFKGSLSARRGVGGASVQATEQERAATNEARFAEMWSDSFNPNRASWESILTVLGIGDVTDGRSAHRFHLLTRSLPDRMDKRSIVLWFAQATERGELVVKWPEAYFASAAWRLLGVPITTTHWLAMDPSSQAVLQRDPTFRMDHLRDRTGAPPDIEGRYQEAERSWAAE